MCCIRNGRRGKCRLPPRLPLLNFFFFFSFFFQFSHTKVFSYCAEGDNDFEANFFSPLGGVGFL